MKRTLTLLALLPLGLWSLFVLPELLAGNPDFWNWRRAIVILSGILEGQAAAVRQAAEAKGLRWLETAQQLDWVAIVLEK